MSKGDRLSKNDLSSGSDELSGDLRALFVTVRDLVLIIDSNEDSVNISDADKIQRFTPISLVGKTLDDVVSPAEATFFRTHVRRAIEEGEEHQVEYPLRIGDERRWFDASVTPITKDTVLWLAQDVTRSKRVEEQLRHQLRLTETITKSLGEGVYALDKNGLLTFMNPAAEQALGWKEEDLLGREIHDVIHYLNPDGSRRPAHDCPLLRVLQTGETTKLDRDAFVSRNGTVLPVSYTASPLLRDGRVVGAVVAFRDITGQKALEEQLRQAQKMEAVGQLAGGVAHDFNNLLTIINGFAARLLDQSALAQSAEKELRAILGAGERAASLTQRLLAFSRPQIVQPRVFSLNKVVEGLEPMLRRSIPENIEITVRLAAEACSVKADESQIEQVIVNLALNARDAMPGGGELEIRTALVDLGSSHADLRLGAKPGSYVVLSIEDTGHGIQAGDLSRIFEPFFTTKEPGKGTGLGLSIVCRVLEQSDGYIEVQSVPGRGALFLVYLPACTEPSAKSSIVHGEGVKRNGKETILLVEDDPGVRAYVETVLKDLGYNVLSASDSEQALETFESYSSSIDLLLTDAVLPGQSGPNLAKRLRRARPQTKVLFMSGYMDDAHSRDLELGADAAFVGKPFSPELLASRLRDVFDTAFSPRPKVLVADDDPSIRALLAGAIEFAGFEALEARDGRETLKICAENDIRLVVTDLAMPRQEGLETIQALRRTLPHVQIIAFSGLSGSAGVLAAAKHLGAAAIFPKPLEVGELIDKIRQLLGH